MSITIGNLASTAGGRHRNRQTDHESGPSEAPTMDFRDPSARLAKLLDTGTLVPLPGPDGSGGGSTART